MTNAGKWVTAWTAKRAHIRYSLPDLERAARHLPYMAVVLDRKLKLLHRVQRRLNRARTRYSAELQPQQLQSGGWRLKNWK